MCLDFPKVVVPDAYVPTIAILSSTRSKKHSEFLREHHIVGGSIVVHLLHGNGRLLFNSICVESRGWILTNLFMVFRASSL